MGPHLVPNSPNLQKCWVSAKTHDIMYPVRSSTDPSLWSLMISWELLNSHDKDYVPTSTSFMTGTGLKKCRPPKRSLRWVSLAMSPIWKLEVLLAKITLLKNQNISSINSAHGEKQWQAVVKYFSVKEFLIFGVFFRFF